MKRMKKLASLFLAMVMVLSMTVAAFADESVTATKDEAKFSITLNHDKPGHTYTAYQVFKGDLLVNNVGAQNETKTLSNIEWAEGINGEELIKLLNADETLGTVFVNKATAREVAEALAAKNENNDSAFLQAFAKVVGNYIRQDSVAANKGISTEGEDSNGNFNETYVISGLKPGYYIVEDTSDSDNVNKGDAYTRYIMQVVADVTANVKVSVPTIDKNIKVGENDYKNNVAAVGQDVYYEIKADVPDRAGYTKYFYVITDTLSKGLTLNSDSLKVSYEGNELKKGDPESVAADDDYYVYVTGGYEEATEQYAPTVIKIAFESTKILDAKYDKDKDFIVTYSAKVNPAAEIGNNAANENKVDLTYSNDPNFNGGGESKPGEPGIPEDNVPKGVTPEVKTETYVAKVDITKYANEVGDGKELDGAGFTIKGVSMQIENQLEEVFIQDNENGTYYKLTDGTYTTEAPHGDIKDDDGNVIVKGNESSYDSVENKYTLTTTHTNNNFLYDVNMTETTANGGKLSFEGLGDGVYVIEETTVPAGYNKAPNIIVEITHSFDADGKITWSVGNLTTKDENNSDVAIVSLGAYALNIVNRAGSLLPSTGGIGRTIFYAAGIILMAGAMFFVVRKKRA